MSAPFRPRSLLPIAVGLLTGVLAASPEPTRTRWLFLDPGLLAEAEHTVLRVNPPTAREVVLRPDRTWEGLMISFYLSILDEGQRLRMWYICRDRQNRPNLAYAESTDGVNWTKPALGLVEYEGSRTNNLVGITSLEGAVFRDEQALPAERYVYLTNIYHEGVVRHYSADGLLWQRDPMPFLRFESDTQNVVLWDDRLALYVVYLRGWEPGTDTTRRRRVVHLTTPSLREPFPAEPSGRPTHPVGAPATRRPWIVNELPTVLATDKLDPPLTDIYNLSPQRYAVDPSWYVGFPALYRHRAESDEPPYENSGRTEVQFAGSADGISWHRYDREPYVRPTLPQSGGGNMAYMGTGLVVRGNEIWQYGTVFHSEHGDVAARRARTDGRIVRYVQRLDGFVSLDTGDKEGRARTTPVAVNGRQLVLNVDTGGIGQLRVGLTDEHGNFLAGHALEDCVPISTNATNRVVTWRGGSDLGALRARKVGVVFASTRTKLYSFRWEQ